MNDIFFNFEVKCMLHINEIYKMQVHFVPISDNNYINLPCTGCDFMHKTTECDLCMKTITQLFKNPDFRPTEPLNVFNYL